MIAVDMLARRAQLSPEKRALVDAATGEAITFAAWNARVNQAAYVLRERLGVGAGDRVAVLAPNCPAYLDVWLACGKLGAILVNLNWRLAERELAAQIAHATPRVILCADEFASRWPASQSLSVLDERAEFPTTNPDAIVNSDDPWVICFTGGSTGAPKGAILTHANITWNAINTVVSWGLRPDDVALLNVPLFHTGGLNVFTAPLIYAGGTSILCKTFDATQVLSHVDRGEVTLLFGVPTMFIALQAHAAWSTTDLARLRLVISGGAACPLPVFEKFWARGVDFTTGYGLTEAGPNTFWLPREQVRAKPGAVGYPLMHVEVHLRDESGQRIETADTAGELCIRGPHVTPGYWNDPAATAAAIDRDGWLHTGDLAQRDTDGAYRIAGRKKEMFISGGENVYPAEVESVIAGHAGVAAVAVVALADATWGEVGCAVIAPATVAIDAVRAHCRANLAAYKVPKRFILVDALPLTTVGKIDRVRIAAMARE